ncbi:hypothetical protein BTHERMOSOX_1086 [Bathymodiolus thermophilus thioautotrophic gill symbiont]|nr:hypothetical protein BTHERMOSOX_1086 [Bathymodiolus thermophilus thioautotrophic gill symbiont]
MYQTYLQQDLKTLLSPKSLVAFIGRLALKKKPSKEPMTLF